MIYFADAKQEGKRVKRVFSQRCVCYRSRFANGSITHAKLLRFFSLKVLAVLRRYGSSV